MSPKKISNKEKEEYDRDTDTPQVRTDAWIEIPLKQEKSLEDKLEEPFASGAPEDHCAFAVAWKAYHFTDNMTMHGIRYIFARDVSKLRRFFWFCIVAAVMSYCIYVMHHTLSAFFLYPTLTYLSTTFAGKGLFPAVTICNYNVFHCVYRDKNCNNSLFTKVLTDFGVCLKFDPSLDSSTAHQTASGPKGGLFFGAQFIPHDWTPGPQFQGQGFRIAIHEPGTTVHNLVNEGISMRAELSAEVTISQKQEHFLEYPYGQCGSRTLAYFPVYTKSYCAFECETNHTVSVCGCKMVHMPGPDEVCSFVEIYECNQILDEETFDITSCYCPMDCSKTKYELSVSHTQPSDSFSAALKQNFQYDISNHGVTFQIFYKDFQIEMQIEEPVYSIEKLCSEIGGAAGLFLGCSVLTFIELFDFLVDILWLFLTKNAFNKKLKNIVDKQRQSKEKNLATETPQ